MPDLHDVIKSKSIAEFTCSLNDNIHQINIPDETGRTPLMLAIEENKLLIAQLLLARGAGVDPRDEKGNTALMWASFYNRHTLIPDLIKACPSSVNLRNDAGLTALEFAVINAHLKSMRVLVEGGALINCGDTQGNTVLIKAVQLRKGPEVIHLLLDLGANLNQLNSNSESALLIAARQDHKASVLALLNRGAQDLPNKKGESALKFYQKRALTTLNPHDKRLASLIFKRRGFQLNNRDNPIPHHRPFLPWVHPIFNFIKQRAAFLSPHLNQSAFFYSLLNSKLNANFFASHFKTGDKPRSLSKLWPRLAPSRTLKFENDALQKRILTLEKNLQDLQIAIQGLPHHPMQQQVLPTRLKETQTTHTNFSERLKQCSKIADAFTQTEPSPEIKPKQEQILPLLFSTIPKRSFLPSFSAFKKGAPSHEPKIVALPKVDQTLVRIKPSMIAG